MGKVNTELTREDVLERAKKSHYLTVGQLKQFLQEHNLPDDAPVVVQRVEDVYYETHHWGVYLKAGEHTHHLKSYNEDIKSGKYFDKDNFPNADPEKMKLSTDQEIKESMEQYTPAWSPVFYKDDPNILFIDLHY